MDKHNETYLITGGNLGHKLYHLAQAKAYIELRIGPVLQSSEIYETQSWGIEEQPSFLNQVLKVATQLEPEELLREILEIEIQMGRKREKKWASRVIDIDILFFNQEIIEQKGLSIPHPQIPYRNFVLIPMAEIAPDFVHPILNKTIFELLKESTDTLKVFSLVKDE